MAREGALWRQGHKKHRISCKQNYRRDNNRVGEDIFKTHNVECGRTISSVTGRGEYHGPVSQRTSKLRRPGQFTEAPGSGSSSRECKPRTKQVGIPVSRKDCKESKDDLDE